MIQNSKEKHAYIPGLKAEVLRTTPIKSTPITSIRMGDGFKQLFSPLICKKYEASDLLLQRPPLRRRS